MLTLSYALDIVPKIKAVSEERWDMHSKVLLPIEKTAGYATELGKFRKGSGTM